MTPHRLLVAPIAVLLVFQPLLPAAPLPQEPPATAQSPTQVPTFGVGTAAVTLDVVVRDKKGNAVRDLKASDFEVYEDGVKQNVESFQVFGKPLETAEAARTVDTAEKQTPVAAPAAPATPAPVAAGSETRPQVIAFVFDRLTADGRDNAHKAAMTYVTRGHVDGDLVGVFAIDLALHTIQPFTVDTSLIRLGLQRAASQANTGFGVDRDQTRQLVDSMTIGQDIADSITSASPSGPGAGSQGGNLGAAASSAALSQAIAKIQVGMLRTFESLERDQQGYASTNGLLSVVNGLKSLPGRKTVVFFSEGLAIPANVEHQFHALIHSANRAGVSVYTMDAAGLRTLSTNQETAKEINQAASRRMRQVQSGRDDAADGIMTRGLERNEDLLRLDPEAGLGRLANETGGFMIRNTNDAASAFRRIEEDMRFHYLLAYSPVNENYDGKFRSISVKVSRPGVQVQSRQGYYAVRPAESAPLRAFESPAIAQLDRRPQPHAFPLEAVALSFPTAKKPGLVPVLVRVPGPNVTYQLDKQDKTGKKIHRADLTVVARVKDPSGREVDRLSQHYELSAAEANLQSARRGDILFYREADLPPGRYTVEAVAYDAVSDKASVSTAPLEVGPAEPGRPRLSSIVLVGRAEKASAAEQSENPLFYGDTIIYPNMGEPFRKSSSASLGFFFTVYGVAPGTPSPRATIEVWKGDAPAGRVTADLPAPDAAGRIQYAGALPLQNFPPGSYRLKVTALADAPSSDSRQASFTIAE